MVLIHSMKCVCWKAWGSPPPQMSTTRGVGSTLRGHVIYKISRSLPTFPHSVDWSWWNRRKRLLGLGRDDEGSVEHSLEGLPQIQKAGPPHPDPWDSWIQP